MPVAGDEGYEKLVICPYDRAHEIRQGRMQFHLDKCRKNFPEKSKEMIQCPFNSVHLIPRVEEMYHTEEECVSRANWERYNVQVGDTFCPVRDLVPVNAATVPDGDENWDDYEAKGSVLNIVKEQAKEKKILRYMQCESKAKRKQFRQNEVLRHESLNREFKRLGPASEPDEPCSSYKIPEEAPLPVPTKEFTGLKPLLKQQDPEKAMKTLDTLDKQFSSLAVKPGGSGYAVSKSFSSRSGPSSEDFPSLPPTKSYASASSSNGAWKPKSAPGSSGGTPLSLASTSASTSTRPFSTAMSSALSGGTTRPPSSMSLDSNAQPSDDWRTRYVPPIVSQDKFCQVPIPGLGRGSRRVQKS